MREILFRAQRKDGKGWVYGDLRQTSEGCYISSNTSRKKLEPIFTLEPIKPETICQFTGLLDKEGVKVFEGDKFAGDEPGEYYEVSWNEDEAIFQINLYGYNLSYGEGSQEIYDDEVTCIDTNCFELSALSSDVVIGNIYEN